MASPWHGIIKDVVAGSNTQHISITMNPSPLSFVVDEFFLGFCFLSLFCFVWCFLVDKINVRSCVSPTATTRQTPVICSFSFFFSPGIHKIFFLIIYLFIYFYFLFFYFFIFFFFIFFIFYFFLFYLFFFIKYDFLYW